MDSPEVIRFTNEGLRPCADKLGAAYYAAKQLVESYDATGLDAKLGDDPTTAHLPTCYIDRARTEARAKHYYQKTDRKILIRILSDLVDNAISREDLKEMSDEEVREQIMNKLGLYEEVQETDFALDNVA